MNVNAKAEPRHLLLEYSLEKLYFTAMKKTERILGIVAVSLFTVGILFKMMPLAGQRHHPPGLVPSLQFRISSSAAAIKSGFQTVVTTVRGSIQKGDDPYTLKREHLLAKWGNYQIRYFFGNR